MRTIICLTLLAAALHARNLTPAWVELAPGGADLARIVVETGDRCPLLNADGKLLPMKRREPVPEGFEPVCEAAITKNARSLEVGGQKLPRVTEPSSVIVFGDTGCRVSAIDQQACTEPAWPFRANIRRVAQAKPDLIVHVGDYLYREVACPDAAKGCGGPHGDNWAAWNADFFEPAAAALAAAPWVFVRGNHESCARSWRGWFYYLDPRPFTAECKKLSDEWIAHSGGLRIGVLDSSQILGPDKESAAYVPAMAAQLRRLSGKAEWMTMHHPVSAYVLAANGAGPGTKPLWEAWQQAAPKGVQLVLSGHTHLFEFLAFGPAHTSQLVAGTGGTKLEAFTLSPSLAGRELNGSAITSGGSRHEFGYTRLRRQGQAWSVQLIELDGKAAFSCVLSVNGNARCGN